MHSLPVFLRLAGRGMIVIGDGDAADAKRRLVERAGGVIVGEQANARLAIVALDDEAEAEAAVARLRARGVLVNAVDRPGLCDFTLPAIVDRSPVLVAIGTGGVSAGLAGALRQRIETLLPADLGRTAEALAAGKAGLSADERRTAAARALGDAPDSGATRTELLRFASPDPDDLTLKQARLLAGAARVYHAADVPPAILARARADAPRRAGPAPDAPGPGLTLDIAMTQ